MKTDTIVWHPVTSPPPFANTYLVTIIAYNSGERFVMPMFYSSAEKRFCHNYNGKVRAWAEIPKPYDG